MAEQLIRVATRDFREDLARYLDSPIPVAITRHGQTIGYYVPARVKMPDEEQQALTRAVEQLASLLADHGVSEDEIVRAFQARPPHG